MGKSEPVYVQIRGYLEELIARNRNTPDYKLPSENQLASLFHASRVPVKRALDDLEAQGLIYRHQGKGSFIAGKNGVTEEQKRVCLLIPRMDSNLYGALSQGVSEVLATQGVRLYNVITEDNSAHEEACIYDCLKQHYDGMIVFPVVAHTYSDAFLQLVLRRYPVVLAGRSFPGLNISYVSCSHYEQCYRATEELIKLGHEHIAYLGEDGYSSPPYQERIQAYRTCMLEHFSNDHLNMQTVNFFDVSLHQSGQIHAVVKQAVSALFDKPVTAIITTNNAIASLLAHMNEMQRENIQLMLFDYPAGHSTSHSVLYHHPMVVYQDFYEIGRVAAQQLLTQIQDHTPPAQIQLDSVFYSDISKLESHISATTNFFYRSQTYSHAAGGTLL